MNKAISLGTVKFGDPSYGLSSNKPAHSPKEVLSLAYELGIRSLDTSERYGNGKSEEEIGSFIKSTGVKDLKISSKIDNLSPNDKNSPKKIIEKVQMILSRLNCEKLQTLYLHQNEIEIWNDPYIIEGIQDIKGQGLCENIGTSLYYSEECSKLNDNIYDVVQVQTSVFNRDLYNLLEQKNIQINARSIFLQGALFNYQHIKNSNVRQGIQLFLNKLDKISEMFEITRIELAIRYVFSLPRINELILGTISKENLKEFVDIFNLGPLDSGIIDLINDINTPSKDWSNPRNW